MEENKRINKKQRIYLIVGIVLFLILILSASYAYFAITSINNATTTTVTGTGEELGSPTLTTNTPNLSLNLTADLMKEEYPYRYNKLYATPTGEAVRQTGQYPKLPTTSTPVTMGNGRYVLATASVSTSDLSYNCTYSFDVSATVTKTINDGSDRDIHIFIANPNGEGTDLSLEDLLSGTKTISGTITNLTKGKNQEFTIESYALNNGYNRQNDLAGNTYTITVTPKSGTNGFKCEVASTPVITGFAKNLIDSNKMKQTGLEGDGYRFVGTGAGSYCLYDNGKYVRNKNSDGTCPNLYSYTSPRNDVTISYNYQKSCPTSTTTVTYSECTTKTGASGNIQVNNYACFGTSDKTECTSNPDKYMYRVIGVFPDLEGNQHVKLIKNSKLTQQYAWHSTLDDNILWHDSDLYKGINGTYFYANTSYDYMQNNTWRNKIADWRWTEATDMLFLSGDVSFLSSNALMDYSPSSLEYDYQSRSYLHEMNRSSNMFRWGHWAYTTAKIGLMYVSDLYLTIPIVDGYIREMYKAAATSWINTDLKDMEEFEWTISRSIYHMRSGLNPIMVMPIDSDVYTDRYEATNTGYVRPVFYLNSDVELGSGTGASTDPYILK